MQKHLEYCIENIQIKKVENAIKLKNFKRKIIESPEKAKDDVKKEYEKSFKKKLKSEYLKWDESFSLFDTEGQQVRFVFKNKPVMIPPIGCTKVIYFPYKDNQEPLESLPTLTPDALRSIFKFLNGWELIELRHVCKNWNKVIVNTHSFWALHIKRFPDEWKNLSSFRLYIKHMFLNYETKEVINFFLGQSRFFIYICGLLMGHNNLTVNVSKNGISVNLYKLTNRGLFYNEKYVQINVFLDAYRQSILE